MKYTIHEYAKHNDGKANITRHVRAPTIFSPSGRKLANPECTMGNMIPNNIVTTCEFPCSISFSKKYTKSSPYPVTGYIHSTATAVNMVATATKNVIQPVPSPSVPHFSSSKLYTPESSPINKSFSRFDVSDFVNIDNGDDEDCSGVEYSCVGVVMEDDVVGVVVVK